MDIQELVQTCDGRALLALSDADNHAAGLALAKLVWAEKYKGEVTGDEGEALTKKEATSRAVLSAEAALARGAIGNDLPCMEEAADVFFRGRMEGGSFGSVLAKCDHNSAARSYRAILEHSGATGDQKSLAHFRLGTLLRTTLSAIEEEAEEQWPPILDHWEQARAITSSPTTTTGAVLATAALARYYYYDKKDYSQAIPLLTSIYKESPYSALVLGLAYQQGNGVKPDHELANQLITYWDKATSRKK